MAKPIFRTSTFAFALLLLSIPAFAELVSSRVPELEIEGLVDNGMVEAKILAVDRDARTLTVRFDGSDETAEVVVPETADIFLTGSNNLERRIDFDVLNAGDNVMLQARVVEGETELQIVGTES